MEKTNSKNGWELLVLMVQMADRLLDYKFWFREIKEYRRLKRILTPPIAIEFSGFLEVNDISFVTFNLIAYTPIIIEKFIIHTVSLDLIDRKTSEVSLYVRNVKWNLLKWWWYLRIIDDTRGEPDLRSLMLYIPQFYNEIDSIRMFMKEIDIEGVVPMERRPSFRKRIIKATSLILKRVFWMKPNKHPILVAKAVYIFSFLKHAIINCHNYWNSSSYIEEMTGYQIEACFKRDYNLHYNYVYDCEGRKLNILIEPETEAEEEIYFNSWRIRNKDFVEERRYLLKLIHLKHCLKNKSKYLAMVVQYKPRIFNSILKKLNPDFMMLRKEKEKHLEKIYNMRYKWSRCESCWIKQARVYCRKFFGYKFSGDKFKEVIVKLHSIFKGCIGRIKRRLGPVSHGL
jgi:hypothetical protein